MSNLTLKTLGLMSLTCAALTGCGEGMPEAVTTSTATAEQELAWPFPFPTPEELEQRARYLNYLSQAGFTNPSELRTTKEIVACDTYVSQGAGTFNSGVTRDCVYQATEYGWGIESVRLEVLQNRNGRGSYTYNTLAEGGQFNFNVQEIGDKWNVALELAAKAADIEVQKKLQIDYQRHMERTLALSANKNTVHLQVTANGGLFEKSEIHVKVYATLVRLQ
ncbi:hypothetical protein D187_000720 [Cystobacter fuscus DSM 2262]|uniref:Lipoprotein n=1 Tax=Cystobacter fuscus (strain ATCC 25194 / DSM 2262 / NBRC 100088 / M29) TaxID=1242864 RepID=S9PM08_CYSF2|nr:hypothetical protein [Cystobacter fuscus]EPX65295.1 hypothetical protein D187_000720 [Cystobacter fuscus DSM 2262]